MSQREEADYSDFVEHPRYGKGPQYSGIEVDPKDCSTVWHCKFPIRGTAVTGDPDNQPWCPYAIDYYFDEAKVCEGCGRSFLFFGLEQKFWYEELGFDFSSQARQCTDCRRELQQVARYRKRYEALVELEKLVVETVDFQQAPDVWLEFLEKQLELMECCLWLIEQSIFSKKQTQTIRMRLNRLATAGLASDRVTEIRARVQAVEQLR